jgi:KDO2-lipid IV(A) lauroyltransferase
MKRKRFLTTCKLQTQNSVETMGYITLWGILRALPLEMASGLLANLWGLIAPKLHRHSRACQHLLDTGVAKTPHEADALARAMWRSLGRTMAESFHLNAFLHNNKRLQVPQDVHEAIISMKATGKGIVFASLHMGNWELCAVLAKRYGIPLAGVYQSLRNPWVDKLVVNMRRGFYEGGLYPKHPRTVGALLSHLRAGGSLGIIADLRDVRGIEVPFFHQPAPSTPLPALLAIRAEAPLCAIAIVRQGDSSTFSVKLTPVDVDRTASREDALQNSTAALHHIFQDWIKATPEQWMWAHRRWGGGC